MIDYIVRHFVKDYQNIGDSKVRDNYGIVASLFGLISNVILFVAKIVIGMVFSSMAIISDALNNMADFGNSSVSLFGFKMSQKPGDKEHPYGHARIEYLASLIIAFVIVIIGVIACVESVHDAIDHFSNMHADIPNLQDLAVMLPILGGALLIKLFQTLLYRGFNRRIHSLTFKGLASDSRNDMITTIGVIISILIGYFTNFNIDGYIGAFVSLLVIYSGLSMGYQAAKILIGEKPEAEIIDKFIEIVKNSTGVLGIHDLEMHCYGPHVIHATIHVEVDASENVVVLHNKMDDIERKCEKELGIHTVVHIDPIRIDDPVTFKYRQIVEDILQKLDPDLHTHDFQVDESTEKVKLLFDIRLDRKYRNSHRELEEKLEFLLADKIPDVIYVINYDQPYEDMIDKA